MSSSSADPLPTPPGPTPPLAPRPRRSWKERPVRPLRIGRFAAAMAATVLALTAATLLLPVDPYVRYQALDGTIYARARWIYERIHFDDAPIDVLVLGSSRSGAGIYPTLLEPALAARGLDLSVANFALPSSGFDLRETLLREVLSEKRPRLVLFEVNEAFPRDGHDAWGDLATLGEVARAPWIVNRNLPRNLARLPIRQAGLALATLLPDAYGRQRDFDPAAYPGTTVDPRDILGFEDDLSRIGTPEHLATLTEQSERRRRSLTPPVLPEGLAWVEFGVSRTYVERIVALAEAHGAEVAFLFLPFYEGPEAPIEEAWLEARGRLWSAEFLRQDATAYEDSAHTAASPEVKAAITGWLADRVAGVLGTAGEGVEG